MSEPCQRMIKPGCAPLDERGTPLSVAHAARASAGVGHNRNSASHAAFRHARFHLAPHSATPHRARSRPRRTALRGWPPRPRPPGPLQGSAGCRGAPASASTHRESCSPSGPTATFSSIKLKCAPACPARLARSGSPPYRCEIGPSAAMRRQWFSAAAASAGSHSSRPAPACARAWLASANNCSAAVWNRYRIAVLCNRSPLAKRTTAQPAPKTKLEPSSGIPIPD